MSYNSTVGTYFNLQWLGPGIALSAFCLLATPLQATTTSQPAETAPLVRAGQVPLPDHCEDPDCPGKNSNKTSPSLTLPPNPDIYISEPFRYGENNEVAINTQAQLSLWLKQALWYLLWN